MLKSKLIKLFILSLFLQCIACKNEIIDRTKVSESETICFDVKLTGLSFTRGTPIDNSTDTVFTTLGILGYHTNSEFALTENPVSDFLPNEISKKSKTGIWLFNDVHYWPQSGFVSFFAYSPFSTPENGITIRGKQDKNPTLSYQLPHTVKNQPDLMIASPEINKFKETVPLNFTHALACIGFDVSGENVAIDSIGIRGVYTSGTLSLNLEDSAPVWTDLNGVNNSFYKVGLIENPMATNPSSEIMETNGYLMMIPQTLSDDAAIIIKFKGIEPKTIPLKKAGTSIWKAGDKYIYSLKEGDYKFDINPTSTICNYSGDSITLNIKSTYTTQSGLSQNLGWKAEVIASSTQNAYWLNDFNNLSDPTGLNTIRQIHINPSPFTTTNPDDIKIRQTDSIRYADIKDLSRINNVYSTANCYVVNAPGWYKFPCWVMGNAISKSQDNKTINNTSCFAETSPCFMNYSEQPIKSSDDLKIDTRGAQAKTLWCDAPQLISKARLSSDKRYIEFYVSPETIRQGNAVIAIQKNNNIMWSWHIWVTDWTQGTNNQATGNSNPDIMPFAIGRCSAATYNYPQRSITIRFTQNTSNIIREITFVQQSESAIYGENAPYYQWGRKDPMIASNGMGEAEDKACFGDNKFRLSSGSSPVKLSEGIRNPAVFYCSTTHPDNWETPISINLWGNAQTEDKVWKTIYDPSPAGYQVPQLHMIFAFVDMTHQFVEAPVNGCRFTPKDGGMSALFLAANGGRGPKDGSLFGTVPPDKGGYYWSNSNFYWQSGPVGSKNTFLNLIFSLKREVNPVYYQVNPSASALNVCPSVQP